jgi:tetratricopeptide (TPR) repeat protein
MTPLRVVGLIGLVFAVTLPFTYVLNHGLPASFGTSFMEDSADEDSDDPVVDAMCLKGLMHSSNGHYDKAITAYTEAIKRDPKYVYAYIGRGDVYFTKGDLDRALADYDHVLRIDPKNAEAKVRAEVIREQRANP